MDPDQLNHLILDESTRLYYYVFVFALYFMLIHMHRKKILSYFSDIPKKVWLKLALITLAGLVIRAALCSMQTITGVTVWSHRLQAVDISEKQVINQISHTRGYSLLLSPIYTITRDIVFSAHFLDIVIGSLSIIAIFLLAYILFKDTDTALISALILCLLPWHIFFSATFGLEIVCLFFIMISLILIWVAYDNDMPTLHFLSVVSVLICALIRKEQSIMILAYLLLLYWKRIRLGNIHIKDFIPIVSALILFIPYAQDIFISNMETLEYGTKYILESMSSLVLYTQYNFYICMLLVIPAYAYLRDKNIQRSKDGIIYLSLWFFISFMPFIFYHRLKTRYFLFFIVPVIILISLSTSRLMKIIGKSKVLHLYLSVILFSASFISLSCDSIDSSCPYLYAQPLRITDIYIDEINENMNFTSNDAFIFSDGQILKALIAQNRDVKANSVYQIESFAEDHENYHLLDEYCFPSGGNLSMYENIYLMDFGFQDYEIGEYNEFMNILASYPKIVIYSNDDYRIYSLIKGDKYGIMVDDMLIPLKK